MTCYMRHLADVLRELGMEDAQESRKILDRQIRRLLRREYDGCPVVWKAIKEQISDPARRTLLLEELKRAADPAQTNL